MHGLQPDLSADENGGRVGLRMGTVRGALF
jgi:hypothetical protein